MRLFARHAVGRVAPPNCACNRCIQPQPQRTAASLRNVVATSEFWWEDEQEFDAVTEVLDPKKVFILVADSASPAALFQGARTELQSVKFQTGFTGTQTQEAADAVWEGRCSPPYFYKLRSRPVLDALSDTAAAGWEQAADDFWKELSGQNWRVELDYGLEKGEKEAEEAVLVVATSLAAERLAQRAVGNLDAATATPPGRYLTIAFRCWGVDGSDVKPLPSWRSLEPQLAWHSSSLQPQDAT